MSGSGKGLESGFLLPCAAPGPGAKPNSKQESATECLQKRFLWWLESMALGLTSASTAMEHSTIIYLFVYLFLRKIYALYIKRKIKITGVF